MVTQKCTIAEQLQVKIPIHALLASRSVFRASLQGLSGSTMSPGVHKQLLHIEQ